MKYCPICQERFDEEIIKFCTRDGTPLVEETTPSFTALPSESQPETDDDLGEQTIIRKKPSARTDDPVISGERIVIPTAAPRENAVRPRTTQAYIPPPPEPNTLKTVVLTVLGTLLVLGFGAGLFWMFSGGDDANINLNVNTNPPNMNMNLGFDSNFNFNSNLDANFDSNLNTNFNMPLNMNLSVPLPSPTPRPSPTPTPTPRPSPSPTADPTPRPSPAATTPEPDETPRTGPRPPMMTTTRPSPNSNSN